MGDELKRAFAATKATREKIGPCDCTVYRKDAGWGNKRQPCGKTAVVIEDGHPRCKIHADPNKAEGVKVETWWKFDPSEWRKAKLEAVEVVASSPGFVTIKGQPRRTARKSEWAEYYPIWEDACNRMLDYYREKVRAAVESLQDANEKLNAANAIAKAGKPVT